MTKQPLPPLIDFFKDIKDPRVERNKAYPLIEGIVSTLLAVMAFAEGGKTAKNTGMPRKGG